MKLPKLPSLCPKWTVEFHYDPWVWIIVTYNDEPWEGAEALLDQISDFHGSKGGPRHVDKLCRCYFFNDAIASAVECVADMSQALGHGPAIITGSKNGRLIIKRKPMKT